MSFFRFPPFFYRLQHRARQLLPSRCVLCEQNSDDGLCAHCQERYFQDNITRCAQCALPVAHAAMDTLCGACIRDQPAFDATITTANYQAPIDQMIQSLKFHGQLAIAPVCARLLCNALLRKHQTNLPDYLIPIPLSPQRLAERGFNQSLEITKPFARAVGIPLLPRATERIRDTIAQSSLPWRARQTNLHQAFCVTPTAIDHLCGRHIGVVDDVMTTGATLQAMAEMLKRFGASKVTNFVVARTLK